MRRAFAVTVLAGMLVPLAGCGAPQPQQPQQQIDFQKIIATAQGQVYPALVFVKPIQETFYGGERRRMEVFGSGVIIREDGYVVTNYHVAEKAIEVNCVLGDREQVPATVVGIDPETDLALLKLKLPKDHAKLTVAGFGDSDKVEAGQFVMALGAPFGFTRSISLGIISNTKRYIGFTTRYTYNLWIQTDAAINPGNSGGPLVDTSGHVIGINTLGAGDVSIGFAIPCNVVRDIAGRLLARSEAVKPEQWPVKVERTYLGLQLQALKDFNTNTFSDCTCGVLVQSVDAESPAATAGLRDGDVLLSVNDKPVSGMFVEELPSIRVAMADLPVDKPTTMLIARGQKAASRPTSRPSDRDRRVAELGALLPGRPTPRDDQPETAAPGVGLPPVPPKAVHVPTVPDSAAATMPVATMPAVPLEEVKNSPFAGKVGERKIYLVSVQPITRGKFEGEDFDCKIWNMTVKEITKFSNPYLHFLRPEGGVYVQGVRSPGNASDSDIHDDDIILKIGKTDIKTLADVKKAYETLTGDKTLVEKKVLVTLKRGGFMQWKTLNWQRDYLKED